MKINTPSNQINYQPRMRNPMNFRMPGPPIPSEGDNTLGNIAGIMGAGAQILGQAMRVADSYANYRAQQALPGMYEEAGRVFDEMEAYSGDDFHEELQRRLDDVYTGHAEEYQGMTRNVIDANWAQWKGERVDRFETQISGRNRQMEMESIVAKIQDPATSREDRAILGQSLVEKNYMGETQAQQLVAETEHNLFIEKQIERYAASGDPATILSLLEQDEDGNWVQQFEGKDINAEDRQMIIDGASQILQQQEDLAQRQLMERSAALSGEWENAWTARPGSVTRQQVHTAWQNKRLSDPHHERWMSRIRTWQAEQNRPPTDADLEDTQKNILFNRAYGMLNENINQYAIEAELQRLGEAVGIPLRVTDSVIDDMRASYDELRGQSIINDAVKPLEEYGATGAANRLREELRPVLREQGPDAVRARVEAEMIEFQKSQIEELFDTGWLTGRHGPAKRKIFSRWGSGVRHVSSEEDAQQLHPLERLVSFASSASLSDLRESDPQLAQSMTDLITTAKPTLDAYASNELGKTVVASLAEYVDSRLDSGVVSHVDDVTGEIIYTEYTGTGDNAIPVNQYRPVIRGNVVRIDKIGPTDRDDAYDFMDDMRLEMGMYPALKVQQEEDANGNQITYLYGSNSTSARGDVEWKRLRPLSEAEERQFNRLPSAAYNTPLGSRRYGTFIYGE